MISTDSTLRFSFNLSVAIHCALFALYFYLIARIPKTERISVSDIDIFVPAKEKKMQAIPASGGEPMTAWNFLKMALPQLPVSEPRSEKITTPIERKIHLPESLPQEQTGKVFSKSELNIPLSQKSLALAETAAKEISAGKSELAMPASLEIEEIGSRRAPALPPDLTLENKGMPAYKAQTLQEVKTFVAAQRARPTLATPLSPETAGGGSSAPGRGSKIARFFSAPTLPGDSFNLEAKTNLTRSKTEPILPKDLKPKEKKEILQSVEKKKAAEITGPISKRKILKTQIPSFPDWAREQGILEASVSIRFYVSREGRVLSEMNIERSSGYGALDRLAKQAITEWLFAPADSGLEREWGIITFRFILQ